jgi:hypothetical protein
VIIVNTEKKIKEERTIFCPLAGGSKRMTFICETVNNFRELLRGSKTKIKSRRPKKDSNLENGDTKRHIKETEKDSSLP